MTSEQIEISRLRVNWLVLQQNVLVMHSMWNTAIGDSPYGPVLDLIHDAMRQSGIVPGAMIGIETETNDQ